MTQSEIIQHLSRIVGQVVGKDNLSFTPDTSAEDVAGWDSFNHINIVMGTEMEFGVRFNTSEVEQLKNVGEFAALIEKKLAKKK